MFDKEIRVDTQRERGLKREMTQSDRETCRQARWQTDEQTEREREHDKQE